MGPSFHEILPLLERNRVRFILIGGGAAVVHGSARATYDIDVVYARTGENIRNLVSALAPHQPYLRGAPPGLPFCWDERTVQAGLNFTLTTGLGDLDLLGEVTGGGTRRIVPVHTGDHGFRHHLSGRYPGTAHSAEAGRGQAERPGSHRRVAGA